MQTGSITGYFDVAQLTLYAFWIFFAGLVVWIRREDKREGYPLIPDRPNERTRAEGFPASPPPKVFLLGREGVHETRAKERPIAAVPTGPWPGAPLEPTGNPMIDGVGPASWAMRTDEPDVGFDDRKPKIVPLRVATDFWVATEDPNPVGMAVVGADGQLAGTCTDIWVDRSETIIRYLEVEVPSNAGPKHVLLPMGLARVVTGIRSSVRVASILASQFADAPTLRNPDQVTLREEDMIMAYFGSGHLYATPSRLGPVL